MNISKETKKKNVHYIMDEIKKIITTFGDRDPGSEGEKKAQYYMGDELKKYSDIVEIEDFKLNPGSFFGWIPIMVTLSLLGYLFSFFLPIVAIALNVLGLVFMLTMLIFYTKLLDPLFKEKTSYNVMAVKKPTGDVKRRIILNGHADATWEWTINYKFGGKVLIGIFLLAMIGVALMIAFAVTNIIINKGIGYKVVDGTMLYLNLALLIFMPCWIGMYWFSNSKVVVPGANDNLTACMLSVAVLKAMKEEGIELENTEVCALLTGSEEAGLRGAKAWAARHKNDYKDCETYILSFETLRETKHLTIYGHDLNGFVKTDKDVVKLFKDAGKNCGHDLKVGSVSLGATDSTAFTQAGFKACCLGGLDHNLQDYYHTRKDNYDNLSEECLSVSYDVALEAVKLFDEKNK